MRILVRLPNWLGDLVMSTAFLTALRERHPAAEVHLIVKDTLTGLAPLLPGGPFTVHRFSKAEWKGPLGPWRFGRHLRRTVGAFDAYFSLPNSFSAALLGLASGALLRVGFRGEAGWLFTARHPRPAPDQHRAAAYVSLLAPADGEPAATAAWAARRVHLLAHDGDGEAAPLPHVNVNSEAQSRRLPVGVALRVLEAVRQAWPGRRIVLVGAPKERTHVQMVIEAAPAAWRDSLINAAGATDLPGLAAALGTAPLLVSSDSGPAHLAAAQGAPTVALFGQGFEAQTGPLGPHVAVVRAPGPRPCEGCPTNRCRFGDEPPCLTGITDEQLALAIDKCRVTSGE